MRELLLAFIGLCVATTLMIVCMRTWFPDECFPPYCTDKTPRFLRASSE